HLRTGKLLNGNRSILPNSDNNRSSNLILDYGSVGFCVVRPWDGLKNNPRELSNPWGSMPRYKLIFQ
ncbi:MAG: hypothetical protein ABIG63_21455, partial [Chloroflexota bacterium]